MEIWSYGKKPGEFYTVSGHIVCNATNGFKHLSRNVHFWRCKVWPGHMVASLHHLVEPGVHHHAGVGAHTWGPTANITKMSLQIQINH